MWFVINPYAATPSLPVLARSRFRFEFRVRPFRSQRNVPVLDRSPQQLSRALLPITAVCFADKCANSLSNEITTLVRLDNPFCQRRSQWRLALKGKNKFTCLPSANRIIYDDIVLTWMFYTSMSLIMSFSIFLTVCAALYTWHWWIINKNLRNFGRMGNDHQLSYIRDLRGPRRHENLFSYILNSSPPPLPPK